MNRLIVSASAGALCLAACASAEEPTLEGAEAFMWAYTEAWNAHDTETLGRDFWQMTDSVEEETARLEAIFAQMEAEGYDRSTIHEILVCPEGEPSLTRAPTFESGEAWAAMRFTRYLTNGEIMGAEIRASSYDLAWTEEQGWRIVGMGSALEVGEMTCAGWVLYPPLSSDER